MGSKLIFQTLNYDLLTMKIDDALAKGLAKQLISWWKDDLSNAISEFKKNINPSMLLNKDGLLKVKELHKFYFKRFTF